MKKALLLGNEQGRHPLHRVEKVLRSIYDGLFDITATEAYGELTFEQLKEYDVVISYADQWDAHAGKEAAAALVAYVNNGGNLLGLHCGLKAPNTPELSMLYGAKYVSTLSLSLLDYRAAEDACEPLEEKDIFKLVSDPSLIAQAIYPFKLTEEPMCFEQDLFTPRKTLVEHSYGYTKCPAMWCHPYGMGRVVCMTVGHSPESFVPPVRLLLYRAGLWLTDRL